MNNVFNFLVVILALNFSLTLSFGVNLKKWYGWAQVLAGFMLGLVMIGGQNIIEGIFAGVLLALITIWLGPIVWRRKHL